MIINCPSCSGPIFKTKTEDVSLFECVTKCPHCRKIIEIEIRREVVVIINGHKVDGLRKRDENNTPKMRTL
jgi:hypothetical protein